MSYILATLIIYSFIILGLSSNKIVAETDERGEARWAEHRLVMEA